MKNNFKKIIAVLLCLCMAIPVFSVQGFAEGHAWDGTTTDTEFVGSGTKDAPYQISTAAELAGLASLVNEANTSYNAAYYVLTADVYLNDIAAYDSWNAETTGLNEWTPIGHTNAFKGVFDGNGYTVYGMYMSGDTDFAYVGIFGVAEAATIKNVRVAYAYIDIALTAKALTDNGNWGAVGILVGRIHTGTSVSDCLVSATLKVSKPSGTSNHMSVGGVVGEAGARKSSDAAQSPHSISGCAFDGSVSATNCSNNASAVGGIVGDIAVYKVAVTLSECYNAGAISADTPKAVGGIFGQTHGMWGDQTSKVTVSNCYNTGAVTATTSASGTGGIGGFAYSTIVVENCFNTGAITDSTRPRQIVSDFYAATNGYTEAYNNIYIDKDSGVMAGVTAENDIAIALSLSSGEFNAENMDLPLYATTVPSEVTTYDATAPVWDGTIDAEFVGEGTEAAPYEITSAAELAGLASLVNDSTTNESCKGKYYVLTNDIYLNDVSNYSNWNSGTQELNEWTPIGSRNSGAYDFIGHFDGQGHTVYGMYIGTAHAQSGLFGLVNGKEDTGATVATDIKNLNIAFSYIAKSGTSTQGGLAGRFANGVKAYNCSVSVNIDVSISGSVNIGGIVGYAANGVNIVENCANYGDITVVGNLTNNYIGVAGIVGGMNDNRMYKSAITGCYNEGNITFNNALGRGVAGIVGYVGDGDYNQCITVSNCYNAGAISTDQNTDGVNDNMGSGGIVGNLRTTSVISNCINVGSGAAYGIYGKDIRNNTTFSNNYYASENNTSAGAGKGTATAAPAAELGFEKIWIFTEGELPTLAGVCNYADTEVLGATIRESMTHYYKNGEEVAYGQGLLFGAKIARADKYMDGEALADGYTVGIIITRKDTEDQWTIEAKNTLEYDTESKELTFSGYLVGIDAENFDTEFVVRTYIKKDGKVLMYSDAITRSVSGVAEAAGGTLDENGNYCL